MELDKKAGKIVWKINIGDNVFNLLMEGSRLYVDGGNLFVVETEDELVDSTWPLWRADEEITGRVKGYQVVICSNNARVRHVTRIYLSPGSK